MKWAGASEGSNTQIAKPAKPMASDVLEGQEWNNWDWVKKIVTDGETLGW